MNKFSISILTSLAFFDIFDYPMTPLELWQYSDVKCKLEDVFLCLQSGELKGGVESKNGFYFFKGREEIVEKRMRQYNLVDQKFKIAIRAIKFLRFLNGVRMIAVCNNFSYSEGSDIDLFIIIRKGRMWLTRFLITILVHLLGVRRHGQKVANRICLSFYITDDNLNLEKITLPQDPYFYNWLIDLIPVYDDGVYAEFWQENSWLLDEKPNAQKKIVSTRRRIKDSSFSDFWKSINLWWFDSFIGNLLEKLTKILQKKKMSHNLNSLAQENDSRVIISDQMLKFHEGDRREEYRREMESRLEIGN